MRKGGTGVCPAVRDEERWLVCPNHKWAFRSDDSLALFSDQSSRYIPRRTGLAVGSLVRLGYFEFLPLVELGIWPIWRT